MSNQVGTVLLKERRRSRERTKPPGSEPICGSPVEVRLSSIFRQGDEEGGRGQTLRREWIQAKRLAFNKLNVTTASVFLVCTVRAPLVHALAAARPVRLVVHVTIKHGLRRGAGGQESKR